MIDAPAHSPDEEMNLNASAHSSVGGASADASDYSPLEGESVKQGHSPKLNRWGVIKRQYTQKTLKKAKALRQNQTDAEGLLWCYLCNKQLGGYKFRRQHPIGRYIVDFACLPQKLFIELDGGQHTEQKSYDRKRDEFLREQSYTVLHFWSNEVFENCFGVLEKVYEVLSVPPPHQPAPRAERSGLASATPPQGGSR